MKNNKKHKEQDVIMKTKLQAQSFFALRTQKVAPTVTAPPHIHPNSITTPKITISTVISPTPKPLASKGDPLALQLLSSLQHQINFLPWDTEQAAIDHPLAAFSGDPVECVRDGEDAWETWDGPLNGLLQKDSEELTKLVVLGPQGLQGLHRFLSYLISEHGVQGCLLKGKLE